MASSHRGWYSVKCLYRHRNSTEGTHCYEEITKLWRADSFKDSHDIARKDTKAVMDHNQNLEYIGRSDSFHLYDEEIEHRTIVGSYLCASNFTPAVYAQCFFDNEVIEKADSALKPDSYGWFSVRGLYSLPNEQTFGDYLYEEKVSLIFAKNIEDALLQAKSDSALYMETIQGVQFLGRLSIVEIEDDLIGHGTHLWSRKRMSALDAYDYIRTFIDTGKEFEAEQTTTD